MMQEMIRTGMDFRGGVRCGNSIAYLPVHDHKRLPGRFFARLRHSDGLI